MHPLRRSDFGRQIPQQQPWEALSSARRRWISETLLSSAIAGAEGIVGQGQLSDRFHLSLLRSSDCQWRCIHHLCKHRFSPAITFRSSVWMTWLEKHICLTAPSNFHSSLFSGVSAVRQLAFSWDLFQCCDEGRKIQCDMDMLYGLSEKDLYLLKMCVISGCFHLVW